MLDPSAVTLALPLIKRFEGLRFEAYPDPASPRGEHLARTGEDDPALAGDPWTVGYGATGPDIGPGTVWAQHTADDDLANRVAKLAGALDSLVRVGTNASEGAALISLGYNIGIAALEKSTLLRKLNAGDRAGAAAAFAVWNHAGGKVNADLTKRRAEEQKLFSTICLAP